MPEAERPDDEGYPAESTHGTTVADHRHVGPEEAEAARETTEAPPELPEPDPRFDVD